MQPEEHALIELSDSLEASSRHVDKLAAAQAYFLAAAEIIMEQKEVLNLESINALKKALEKHLEFHDSMNAKNAVTLKSLIHDH